MLFSPLASQVGDAVPTALPEDDSQVIRGFHAAVQKKKKEGISHRVASPRLLSCSCWLPVQSAVVAESSTYWPKTAVVANAVRQTTQGRETSATRIGFVHYEVRGDNRGVSEEIRQIVKDKGKKVGGNRVLSKKNNDGECLYVDGRVTGLTSYSSRESNVDFTDMPMTITGNTIGSSNSEFGNINDHKMVSGGGNRSIVVVGTDKGSLHCIRIDTITYQVQQDPFLYRTYNGRMDNADMEDGHYRVYPQCNPLILGSSNIFSRSGEVTTACINDVDFNIDGKAVASVTDSGSIALTDINCSSTLTICRGYGLARSSVKWSGSDNIITTGIGVGAELFDIRGSGKTSSVRMAVSEVRSGIEHKRDIYGSSRKIQCIDVLSNQPHFVAGGGRDGAAFIWDLRKGEENVTDLRQFIDVTFSMLKSVVLLRKRLRNLN